MLPCTPPKFSWLSYPFPIITHSYIISQISLVDIKLSFTEFLASSNLPTPHPDIHATNPHSLTRLAGVFSLSHFTCTQSVVTQIQPSCSHPLAQLSSHPGSPCIIHCPLPTGWTSQTTWLHRLPSDGLTLQFFNDVDVSASYPEIMPKIIAIFEAVILHNLSF